MALTYRKLPSTPITLSMRCFFCKLTARQSSLTRRAASSAIALLRGVDLTRAIRRNVDQPQLRRR